MEGVSKTVKLALCNGQMTHKNSVTSERIELSDCGSCRSKVAIKGGRPMNFHNWRGLPATGLPLVGSASRDLPILLVVWK